MNTNKLSLKEVLYLISVKDKDGRANAEHLEYGLIGACLMELASRERIAIRDKHIEVLDSKPTNDDALDLVLKKIAHSKRRRKIKTWVAMLVNKSEKVRRIIRDSLYEKQHLGQEQKKFLFIPYTLHPVAKTDVKKAFTDHLKKAIQEQQSFGETESNLIALMYVSASFRNIFHDRKERRHARKRVKAMIKEGAIASAVSDSIREMQAAITAAVATSVAVSAAATSSN
jgi:hypothetical protein